MRRLWPLALGSAIIIAVLAPLLLTNLILARGDVFLYFYPYWDARAAAFRELRLPLWTPDIFMGAPFLANPQSGVLYPLNWPLTPFDAPLAVKISLGVHALIAWAGTYVYAGRRLALTTAGAALAATTFALGGYVLAQAEHINQFQALAWFPWLLYAAGLPGRTAMQRAGLAGLVLALQVLAGHTQTVVICGLGAALVAVAEAVAVPRQGWRPRVAAGLRALTPLIGAALIAAILAAGQLLPTLELQDASLRRGGLPWREAVSFSLDPRILGPALLPGYSRSLFTEFVAYPGVLALGLAALGAAVPDRRRWTGLALVVVGLVFALGAYSPVYAGLAFAPPFNLFRVPARWLALFAFGVALLAGQGLDSWSRSTGRMRLWASLAALLPLALVPLAIGRNPPGETGPLAAPALSDWLGWGLAWLGLLAVVWIPRERLRLAWLAVVVTVLELGWSARALPLLATLTAPEAYNSLRPALTQLLIDPARDDPNGAPPGRVLSMSALQFDPGDLGELKALYGPQLSASGYETLIVATKHKEVLSPNLALTWRVPGVDGFDGGVLPTRAYAEFAALFTGEPSSDGRLREHVTVAPDPRWLALVDARWLITDKTGDDWIEGIAYDRLFTQMLPAGETANLTIDPPFPATELGVIAATPGRLVIVAGDRRVELTFANGLDRIALPFAPEMIELQGPLTVEALTIINAPTGAFQMIPLRNVRLAHSGDVKVYEMLDRMSRAFVTETSEVVDTIPDVLARLNEPGFDPARIALVSAGLGGSYEGDGSQGAVRFVSYTPEEVVLEATGPGTLVLTDAFASGWHATLDGAETPIVPAFGLFRAIALPPGTHAVRFVYAPQSVTLGLALSGLGLALWLFAFARPRLRSAGARSIIQQA